ncbi:endolytic transglycosylase MltG [Nocardioides sp.]|uniref:endolytic transglycosylase MltG n=1 Tax=Nocardioides sp. TaxID=35761 RepID=UPI0027345E5E|nr:endolytic transglycosylase MltG [Nocardioides sp.]MDP3893234.1 endolytic transglycosylase MltG [Nocardioides sp.]
MSEVGLPLESPEPTSRRGRRRKKRGAAGCIAVLLAVVVLGGGFYFAVMEGVGFVREQFGDPEDFTGPGGDPVVIEVMSGDSAAAIGRTLKDEGVVASVGAFTAAAAVEPDSAFIQPGYYELPTNLPARDAVALLIDRGNMVQTTITIPEGFRASQIVARLAENTDFGKKQFERVLDRPGPLDLPAYAEGNPEGFLFPATYAFGPEDKPVDMLKAMVDRFKSAADEVPLSEAASRDLDEGELVTVASIIEKEVNRPEDLPAVAEVFRNRLDGTCSAQGVPRGLLQMDSTVHFLANGGTGSVFTDSEARQSDSPYNTYRVPGLPPGPISSPGLAAMQAVLEPTDEGYCYFVAVDLDTGETAFAATEGEHQTNRGRLADWCRDNPGRC